ncbi:MAG: Gfo/Idh/MocA family oxidoreductase [Pirellulaceae bacterium]
MKTIARRDFLLAAGATTCLGMATPRITSAARKAKIKIGQIGTGHAHASGVFSQLRQTDDFEIVGIVENNPQRRQALGDQYQGVKLISEQQLLNTPGLRAVVVETEVPQLLATAQRCAAANMHIHLDKPAGENLAGFQKLLNAMESRKLHLQMGYIYRYHTAFQFCYQAVANGWLGDLFEVHSVMSKKVNADSRKKLGEFAGGSMFEIGCHVIDATIRVLGKPQKITSYGRKTHPGQDPLVDNQLAVFDYPNAIASVRSTLIEYEGFQRRQFTVCGEFGTFDLRPLGGNSFRLALEHPKGDYQKGYQDVTLPKGPGIFISAFQDMAAILREEKKTDYPLSHELAVHEAILRASGYQV